VHLFGFIIRIYHDAQSSEGQKKKKKKRNLILSLKEIEWFGVDRVYLAQDINNWRALVSSCEHIFTYGS